MNNLTTKATKQFKKSLEKCKSRNNDISLLQEVLQKIVKGEILDKKYRDHKLTNREERELHIQNDWLLIYKIIDNVLYLIDIGTHSDLFD